MRCFLPSIPGLQDTTLALDFRVTVLEENGGGDGNSSVTELEVRVETLEGTAADHETRLSSAETDIEGKISYCLKLKKLVNFISIIIKLRNYLFSFAAMENQTNCH